MPETLKHTPMSISADTCMLCQCLPFAHAREALFDDLDGDEAFCRPAADVLSCWPSFVFLHLCMCKAYGPTSGAPGGC